MKITAIKEHVRDSFLGKWRMSVVNTNDADANIKCISKANTVFNNYSQSNPNESFTIKAHHLSSTTSAIQTAATTTPHSFAVDIKKEEPKPPNTVVKGIRWKTSFKTKLRVALVKIPLIGKPKATPAPTPATATTSLPLTITIPPNLLEDHHPSLESPTDRVKRVALTALSNISRAFSSCLPLTSLGATASPLDQNFEASSSPTTSDPFQKPPNRVSCFVASLKNKGTKLKESLKKKTQTKTNNIFPTTTTTTLDEMMDRMIETINTATGRSNTRYKSIKIVRKLWKRTIKWAAGA
jgi:hypothetical protein